MSLLKCAKLSVLYPDKRKSRFLRSSNHKRAAISFLNSVFQKLIDNEKADNILAEDRACSCSLSPFAVRLHCSGQGILRNIYE
jgi:hypothetical protein